MFRDYKNYRGRKPPRFKTYRAWLSAGVLGILILGGAAAYWLSGKKSTTVDAAPVAVPVLPPSSAATPPVNTQRKEPAPPEPPKKVEPRFTFYKILSEKEVIIPENEVKTIRREELASKSAPVGHYFIQVGSFINQTDAEKLKAQMLQIKIPAKLEMIQVDNSTWFRVKVGPYSTLNDVEKVRHYLKTHRVDSVVQKSNK